jgi:hypothetical protein
MISYSVANIFILSQIFRTAEREEKFMGPGI